MHRWLALLGWRAALAADRRRARGRAPRTCLNLSDTFGFLAVVRAVGFGSGPQKASDTAEKRSQCTGASGVGWLGSGILRCLAIRALWLHERSRLAARCRISESRPIKLGISRRLLGVGARVGRHEEGQGGFARGYWQALRE